MDPSAHHSLGSVKLIEAFDSWETAIKSVVGTGPGEQLTLIAAPDCILPALTDMHHIQTLDVHNLCIDAILLPFLAALDLPKLETLKITEMNGYVLTKLCNLRSLLHGKELRRLLVSAIIDFADKDYTDDLASLEALSTFLGCKASELEVELDYENYTFDELTTSFSARHLLHQLEGFKQVKRLKLFLKQHQNEVAAWESFAGDPVQSFGNFPHLSELDILESFLYDVDKMEICTLPFLFEFSLTLVKNSKLEDYKRLFRSCGLNWKEAYISNRLLKLTIQDCSGFTIQYIIATVAGRTC